MRRRIVLVIVLRARVQPPLQFGDRRRQHEHADQIAARLFAQLLGALPIDVEQHVAAGGERLLTGSRGVP